MEGGFLEDAFDVDGKLACCGLLVPFLLADLAELLTPDFRSTHLMTTSQRGAVCLTAFSLMPNPRKRLKDQPSSLLRKALLLVQQLSLCVTSRLLALKTSVCKQA